MDEDWHDLARMLPDRPLEEEDIDVLGRRAIATWIMTGPPIGQYINDDILGVTTGSDARRRAPRTSAWIISH